MKSCVIIPARFESSRYPGKPLVPLLGKPMILWVAEVAAKAVAPEDVYIATDDSRISAIVEEAGFQAIMTSGDARTGTDRVAEAAESLDYDIYSNVQGDEPLLDPRDIRRVIERKSEDMDSVVNGYCWIGNEEDPNSPNIPKVVATEAGELLYMSRSAIPGFKDSRNAPARYKKQVCIYAFTRDELMAYRAFGRKSLIESCEDIEILRFFELGRRVVVVETSDGTLAVDVPENVAPVEAALRRRAGIE